MNHKKKQQIYDLISNIRYDLTHGVHTYGPCCREGCTEIARGAGACSHCLADDLGKLVGEDLAQEFRLYTEKTNRILGEMLDE